MPKITHVTVGLRRLYKHPFEDFENFTIEGSITTELEPGDDAVDVAKKSFPVLREQMLATFKEFRPKPPVKKESR